MGANNEGCLGLADKHNVKTPELCGQRIQQFINGSDYVLAMNEDNHVFSWGGNEFGQLGRDLERSQVWKIPQKISELNDKNITQISCSVLHSLALTIGGQVYGWGHNKWGQVGCENNSSENLYKSQFIELSDKPIGSGGFGTVFKVKNKIDEQIYAVKRVEINVHSEYVVQYFNSWTEVNSLYIQMEFCTQNLRNILEVKPQVFGRQLGEAMDCVEYFISCEILRQILESVQYLHELNPQIIHRDLKPENILITENIRNGRFIKLCDVGLATFHDKNINYMTRDKHSTGVGTLKYQAPEVVQGIYGHKVDIYSLALIGQDIFEFNLFFIDNTESLYSGNEILNTKGSTIAVGSFTASHDHQIRVVRSEYCVQYYNSLTESKHLYIQMEFCSQNLRNILEVKPQVFGRQIGEAMDFVEYFISCEIFRQVLESVQYLHKLDPQIIHRDLKPSNILIDENVKNGRFIKLCDFGVGTLKYQAPEISQGSKYGLKVDIYSLAIIGSEIFELDLFYTDPDNSESSTVRE
ncbi:unnamed protein product [Oppiella nova]|uniref:Protein kinase domain-containing protein n=1 Tax=Oppiella nova TaxID=334625 RepID=A0A7R9QFL7_9ACAR|nr:unnamed protein product [Oppiella nova]CAG2164032.1 unnamed protein product [Oppiella nova]